MTAAPPPPSATGATRAAGSPIDPADASTGQLITQLTEQVSRLVRDEARLAQAEVAQKAKRLGIGAGLFGGAGLFAFLGLAVLVPDQSADLLGELGDQLTRGGVGGVGRRAGGAGGTGRRRRGWSCGHGSSARTQSVDCHARSAAPVTGMMITSAPRAH